MALRVKYCAFCSNEAVTKGGEHLWDNWLNRELPKKTLFNARKRLSITSSPIQFVTKGLQEKVPAVCPTCNSGWMSELTNKVKHNFAESILKGKSFSLGPREGTLLAAFTFMKAVVKDYHYGDEPFFTRAVRERFRISLSIPNSVKVWIAAYQGSARWSFHSNFCIIAAQAPGPLAGMEFFSYTYIDGNLALQLLAPRWKDVRRRSRPLLSIVPNPCWGPAVIQFWPYAGNFSWPPARYLGDDVVEEFLERFTGPIMVPVRRD
jgi:hypothetical protein